MSSPHSPAAHMPSSSPVGGGTELTAYSPETVRKINTGRGQSAVAADERPVQAVAKVTIKNVEYQGLSLDPEPHQLGTFIDELSNQAHDFISRFVFVGKLPDGTVAGTDQEMELHHVQSQMKLYLAFANCVPVYNGGLYLRFDSIQYACEAQQLLNARGFEANFIDNYDFALAKSQDTAAINEFEGQIRLIVLVESATMGRVSFKQSDIVWLSDSIEDTMGVIGSVRTYVHYKTVEDTTKLVFSFRFEFFSAEAATRAVALLQTYPIGQVHPNNFCQWRVVGVSNWMGPRPPNSPHRYKPRIDDKGRLVEYLHLPQIDPNARPRHPADAHNRVRRERILDGTDVRTTIMLRNIPNKVDWLSLKALLDQVCFGTYDFMYLRIDFKTGMNVGYAFINFSDVGGMIAMLDRIEGCGWVGYRSNKNAEISYATIQGREALVSKFRNSSVMQETPFCRPRLFLSRGDAVATDDEIHTGVEQSFPSPDNLSKLQRSMETARTVGLYPPSGMANTGHRLTMTGFDRGNPRDQRQGDVSRVRPEMTQEMKQECEYFNFHKYGPSSTGSAVPFEYLSARVVDEFLDEYQGNNTRANIADPGVIGRPRVVAPSGAMQQYPAGLDVFGPRPGPIFQSRAPATAVAGTSTPFRGYNTPGAGPSASVSVRNDAPRLRISGMFQRY